MSNPYAREPLGVALAGLEIRVPWAAADRWIDSATSSVGPIGVLTGLTDDVTADRVIELAIDGRSDPEEIASAAYDLIGQAVPYRWWKTVRLLALSTRDDIAGHLTLSGVDPRSVTVAQWCMAVYVLITRNADGKEKFKVDAAFDDPPPGIVDDEWMSDDDFNAMVASARAMPGQS